ASANSGDGSEIRHPSPSPDRAARAASRTCKHWAPSLRTRLASSDKGLPRAASNWAFRGAAAVRSRLSARKTLAGPGGWDCSMFGGSDLVPTVFRRRRRGRGAAAADGLELGDRRAGGGARAGRRGRRVGADVEARDQPRQGVGLGGQRMGGGGG